MDVTEHRRSGKTCTTSHGKPIILYDVVSNGTTNYMNLAKEVLEKNER